MTEKQQQLYATAEHIEEGHSPYLTAGKRYPLNTCGDDDDLLNRGRQIRLTADSGHPVVAREFNCVHLSAAAEERVTDAFLFGDSTPLERSEFFRWTITDKDGNPA